MFGVQVRDISFTSKIQKTWNWKNVLLNDNISGLNGLIGIASTIVVSAVVYLVAAHVFGVEGIRKTVKMLKDKKEQWP